MNSYILHQEAMEPKKKIKDKTSREYKMFTRDAFRFRTLSLFISSYTMLNKIKRF